VGHDEVGPDAEHGRGAADDLVAPVGADEDGGRMAAAATATFALSPRRSRRALTRVRKRSPVCSAATASLSSESTRAGSGSARTVARSVYRAIAVSAAASGPLPQTSPTAMNHASGPAEKTS
jgi:hypothetical protein